MAHSRTESMRTADPKRTFGALPLKVRMGAATRPWRLVRQQKFRVRPMTVDNRPAQPAWKRA